MSIIKRKNNLIEPDVLSDASYDEHFYLKDGRTIKNLKELLERLKDMDEDTFKHHVNENKNDFVRWIGLVIKDHHLAEKLIKIKNRKKTIRLLEKRLKEINKNIKNYTNIRETKEEEKKENNHLKMSKTKNSNNFNKSKRKGIKELIKIKEIKETSFNPIKPILRGLLIGLMISILLWCIYVLFLY